MEEKTDCEINRRTKTFQAVANYKIHITDQKVPKPMQNKCVQSRAYSLDQGLANIFRDRPDFAGQQDMAKSYIQEQKTTSALFNISEYTYCRIQLCAIRFFGGISKKHGFCFETTLRLTWVQS